ncbi:DUF1998 domain-containing protein [Streptomyces sp. CBMA152]|uniref:DUF1998 domain-containing protein n=1 Tax=Streptomyces sp. CBMA152 TaxID=1896312 RepID=UPI001CB723BD|nr:DUF1998 domain-containing protein [Streptomyces sp. CBMA152]
MTGKALGGVRRAQMITTYGVGSLVAVGSQSFMVAGIDHWPDRAEADNVFIHEPRLERDLRVNGFRLPPASESERRGDVPVVRFPVWHSCPESGVLAEFWRWGNTTGAPTCKEHDDRELVPSRFVMACGKGHIDEFPYYRWVHAGSPPAGRCGQMRIEASGRSAALRDIEISCACGKKVTMEGALGGSALRGVATCTGRMPWLGKDVRESDCDEQPRAMQRGASGVWFSDVASAIDIPPWSQGVQKLIARHWQALGKARHLRDLIEDMGLSAKTGHSIDDLVRAVEKRRRTEEGLDQDSAFDRKLEEYEALTRTTREDGRNQSFVCVPGPEGSLAPDLALGQVMRVERLREVRVLQAFTRVSAPSPADRAKRGAPLYNAESRPDWLPAIEVIGEGVFLTIDQLRLVEWEQRDVVRARAAVIDAAYRDLFAPTVGEADREITPRFVLLHTLAHAIINEWSLDCGYPAAALRERLYAADSMAGMLLYTATSDSAGSLGGIVAQTEPDRLFSSIRRALERAAWCSADPLCIEATASGVDSLNLAACHACVLLPETSCEEYNTLLDRGLLIGTPDTPDLGFFKIS